MSVFHGLSAGKIVHSLGTPVSSLAVVLGAVVLGDVVLGDVVIVVLGSSESEPVPDDPSPPPEPPHARAKAVARVHARMSSGYAALDPVRITIAATLVLACGEPSPIDVEASPPTPAPEYDMSPPEPSPVESTPEAPSELASAWPPTTLKLVLLATQVSDDAARSSATIRDEEAGTIAHYREGDAIRKTAVVHAIERGRVILLHDERRERLEVGLAPAVIATDDVFYADLVDDALGDTMTDGVQLDAGPGWMIKTPAYAWGTKRTVHRLREALRAYARVADGGPDVHVGDISKSGGGPFPPHLSHRVGRDVDIGYVLQGRDADVSRFVRAHAGNLDRTRTWKLIRAMLETRAVAWIFIDYDVQKLLYEEAVRQGASEDALDTWFQYPHGNRAMHGVLRDWRGHDDHFHVRFAQ
jgi:hypothetical protein